MTMCLATLLDLLPLDLGQLNNRAAIREMRAATARGNEVVDFPFLFFQHVTKDELLLLRTPSGYVWAAPPHDVCDVLPGKPLTVRAMVEGTLCDLADPTVFQSRIDNVTAE